MKKHPKNRYPSPTGYRRITKKAKANGARLRRQLDSGLSAPKKGGSAPLYRPGFCEIAKGLCVLGATNEELGERFGVTKETIQQWQHRYPDFKKAIHEGRDGIDARIAASLAHRAMGFSHPDEHIHVGKSGQVTRVRTVKQYPPDTAAAQFWLKNRRPQAWKDRVEHTGAQGGPIDFTLNYVTAPKGGATQGQAPGAQAGARGSTSIPSPTDRRGKDE